MSTSSSVDISVYRLRKGVLLQSFVVLSERLVPDSAAFFVGLNFWKKAPQRRLLRRSIFQLEGLSFTGVLPLPFVSLDNWLAHDSATFFIDRYLDYEAPLGIMPSSFLIRVGGTIFR